MDAYINWLWSFVEAVGLTAFFEPGKRIYYPYLLSAVVLASVYYFFIKHQAKQKRFPKLLSYLFPKSIWLHQSAIVDYQIFVFNHLIKFFLIAPYLIAHSAFAYVVVRCWEASIGLQDTVQCSATAINISYTIVFLILSDFSRFLLHYSLHKIPFLWQFHKVHHAAEVLTPITLYRVHPLEYCLLKLRSLLVFGLVAGTFFFWFRTSIEPLSILQIHAAIFLFNLLGANLRHSHVPIRFGQRVEHFFISPAQHQIHHGSDARFFDKNFGSLFAFWDWLFGSLAISSPREKIAFGLGEKEQAKFRSFWQNLFTPFRENSE